MFYTYVLKNPKVILYKGSTDNPVKRVWQHNSTDDFASFTKNKGPWKLVRLEAFKTRREAEIREKFFKSGKGREFLKSISGNS